MSREHRINLQDAENVFNRRRYIQKLSDRNSAAKWKCKDGYSIFISEMSEAHLINSIKLLERQISKLESERAARLRYMSWDDPVYDEDIDSALDKIKRLKLPLENELAARKVKKVVSKVKNSK